MVKVTVLYDQPDDPAAFEKYYLEVHVPEYGLKIPNVTRIELNKAFPAVGQPPFYRTADLFFESMATFQEAMGSPLTQAAIADLDKFAAGKHKILASEVETKVPAGARR